MAENTRKTRKIIVQTPAEESFCAGCNSCEIICALVHEGEVSPANKRLFVHRNIRTMVHTVYTCRHCEDHPCYIACPKKDKAMKIDENGIVIIDESECVGCGACYKACKLDPPRINYVKDLPREKRKAKKCDMCAARDNGPACVEWCPVRCIELIDDAALSEVSA